MPRKGYLLFLVCLLASAMFVSRAFSADKHVRNLRTLERILTAVEQEYVEPVDAKKLYDGAYRGVLSVLDPYSQFLDQQDTTTFTEDTEGQFGGLGIEISIKDGILTVMSPLRGTPAWDAGLLPGDMILRIDGESTEGITLNEALHKLRGEVGTDVVLTIRHANRLADTEVTITRAVIRPTSVEFAMVDPQLGIGLIRVMSFNARVMENMMEGVEELQSQGLRGLILDVRNNPGGLLDKAVAIADLFLTEGAIVSVRGRRPEMNQKYDAKPGDPLEEIPLVVLVDDGSASASEILAAALKDHNRALLVGLRTYGKGSVQNVFSLGNGEALKLTTARYYRPNDEPIKDRQGIVPDIQIITTREEQIALRAQEREDKLRGTYHPAGLLEESNHVEPPADLGEMTEDEFQETAEEAPRRGRVVDRQLKAAFNALKWQLSASR